MFQSLSKRKILAVCVAASICSHVVSLLFLQKHSLWYASPKAPIESLLSLAEVDKIDRDQILRESFGAPLSSSLKKEDSSYHPIPQAISHALKPLPILQPIEIPKEQETSFLTAAPFPNVPLEAERLLCSFQIPSIEQLNLFEHLPKDLIVPPPSTTDALLSHPPLAKTQLVFENLSPIIQEPKVVLNIAYTRSELTPTSIPLVSEHKFSTQVPLPKLPHLPTLEELQTVSYSEQFDTEVIFSPLENEEGYLFAITLIPHPDLNLPKIRQHFSFLIDRSNSIQKERLAAAKSAIFRAVKDLNFEDSFNIIAFDSKIDKLYSAPMLATPGAARAAKEFLGKIQLGSFFSPANLYKPLCLTLPASDEDLHTTILLTDGESLGKKSTQREVAFGWTAYNQGRASLFTIGLGSDPHLETLDAISSLNRGKLLYSPSKRGIRRKLLKLMKTISHPVAKNISIHAINIAPESTMTLYPPLHQAPHLYNQEPYVILGTTKTLEPFILFLQGKLKGKWLNIKKPIAFTHAKKATISLKSQYALQKAYQIYETYLYDQDPKHLAEARTLLEPYNLRVAFQ